MKTVIIGILAFLITLIIAIIVLFVRLSQNGCLICLKAQILGGGKGGKGK